MAPRIDPERAPMIDPTLRSLIQTMPKAEIHLHLEGSIQPATLLELAKRHLRLDTLPAQDVAGLREWFRFVDFPHFIEVYLTISDLLRTPEDFTLIVSDLGDALADHAVRYAEVTFTPYTHLHLLDKGLTLQDLLQGLDHGRQQVLQRHGIVLQWVFDIPRNAAFRPDGKYNPRPAELTLEYALEGRSHGVIGFGLGGNEVGAPPAPFAHAFATANANGLLSVPHAGETVGAESVWGAIHDLGAKRLGHGVRAVEDPLLLATLHEAQIPLEINPTSNICLHVYRKLGHHPLPHLDRMGLLVTVNTDDPPLFNTDLTNEYALLVDEFGYDLSGVTRIARNAFTASMAPASLREQLLQEFDAWVASALNPSNVSR
jgi:aminodeoxyfutalosine deaminase